jgi:16S rRNA (cytosine967-C5)-methyltransferase
VLLDAPCSGLGVLRRHPEALQRRAPEDLSVLAAQQRRMLEVVAPLLLPGGFLTYAVCTFDRRECEEVLEAFTREHPAFRLVPPAAGRIDWERLVVPGGAACAIRTWPDRDDADAFFAARLQRDRC